MYYVYARRKIPMCEDETYAGSFWFLWLARLAGKCYLSGYTGAYDILKGDDIKATRIDGFSNIP